jgi:hypothetical protein
MPHFWNNKISLRYVWCTTFLKIKMYGAEFSNGKARASYFPNFLSFVLGKIQRPLLKKEQLSSGQNAKLSSL